MAMAQTYIRQFSPLHTLLLIQFLSLKSIQRINSMIKFNDEIFFSLFLDNLLYWFCTLLIRI